MVTACMDHEGRSHLHVATQCVKPRPHQQQCRSNIVECYKVESCSDKSNVALTLLLVWTGLYRNAGCLRCLQRQRCERPSTFVRCGSICPRSSRIECLSTFLVAKKPRGWRRKQVRATVDVSGALDVQCTGTMCPKNLSTLLFF